MANRFRDIFCFSSLLYFHSLSHHSCASSFYINPIKSNNKIKYIYCVWIECECCWHSENKGGTKGPWLRHLFVFPFCLKHCHVKFDQITRCQCYLDSCFYRTELRQHVDISDGEVRKLRIKSWNRTLGILCRSWQRVETH